MTDPYVVASRSQGLLPIGVVGFVQVFGCRNAETIRALGRPASEKRQGTKSRR